MRTLDRKLVRDLALMWSQVLTIAAVVASGVGGFIATLSAVDALAQSRDAFYASGHFADVFATLKRAPRALEATLREVPGVAQVQTTVQTRARLALPGHSDPVTGLLIGMEAARPPMLNQPVLRHRLPDAKVSATPGPAAADGTLPVWVSEAFAQARGLEPGSTLTALIEGRERALRVTGIALSPEYIFAGLFGMPDPRGFGIVWVDAEPLRAATDMEGAFNHVAVTLAPGASPEATRESLQRLLAPWGTREVHGRDTQTSHAMLNNEIREQQVLGTIVPAIFLAVAAFLLHLVTARLVTRQREQIAALKALGYTNGSIAGHYLLLVLAIVMLGYIAGVALGYWLGSLLVGLYAEFFRFPTVIYGIAPSLLALSLAVTLLTAVLGTLVAIRATVRLMPAEAMRPPSPGRYRHTGLERLGLSALGLAPRMIVREMERKAARSTLTVIAMATAVAIVVLGHFVRDSVAFVIDAQFRIAMRLDAALWLTDPADAALGRELARLPGVIAVEAARQVPARLVSGHRSERIDLRGMEPDPVLHRIIDSTGHVVRPPADGLLLSDRLAAKLGLVPGDSVRVEVLSEGERRFDVRISATVQDLMGLNAYVRRDRLNTLLGEGDLVSSYAVALERGSEDAFLNSIRALPRIAGAFSKASLQQNLEDISARNIRIMATVLTLFACVIAIGVVYNHARIALSERSWEMASLRVLGFSRGQVSTLLLGELGLTLALALPLGMLLGRALVGGVVGLLASDQFFFPVIIRPETYALAALTVMGAGAGSAMIVRRRIDQLDLVAALKARD